MAWDFSKITPATLIMTYTFSAKSELPIFLTNPYPTTFTMTVIMEFTNCNYICLLSQQYANGPRLQFALCNNNAATPPTPSATVTVEKSWDGAGEKFGVTQVDSNIPSYRKSSVYIENEYYTKNDIETNWEKAYPNSTFAAGGRSILITPSDGISPNGNPTFDYYYCTDFSVTSVSGGNIFWSMGALTPNLSPVSINTGSSLLLPNWYTGRNRWPVNDVTYDMGYTINDYRVYLYALLMGDIDPVEVKTTFINWKVYLDGKGVNVRKAQFIAFLSDDMIQGLKDGDGVTLRIGKSENESFPNYGSSITLTEKRILIDDVRKDGSVDMGTYTMKDLLNGSYIPLLTPAFVSPYVSYFYDERRDGIIGSLCYFNETDLDKMNKDSNRFNSAGEVGKPSDGSTLLYQLGYYEPSDPDDQDPTGSEDDPNSDKVPESTGYDSSAILTKTYAMTKERCQSLGGFLWSASFIDNIKLVNNSPIENVVSIKVFPFPLVGSDESIVLGNVDTGVNGALLDRNVVTKSIGSISLPHIFGNFLDYAPFTKISIHLPFIGFRNIDTNFYLDRTLSVSYIIDLVTGSCKAILYADGNPVESYDGSMGIDIPLVGSNRAQLEAGYVSSFIGGVASGVSGGAVGMIKGGISASVNNAFSQFHSEKAGGTSPQCSAYMTKECFVIVDYPNYSESIGSVINHTKGRLCMQTSVIKNCSGFTQTTPEVDLSGITAMDEEKEMIRNLLSSGIIV